MNADGRILIADDEDSLRWVLEKGFRSAGYQVTAVKDGTAALREVEAGPFDLILLDIRMPHMDGYEVAARLAQMKLENTKVVAVTASAMVGDRERITAAGFDGYIQKPIDPETFIADIQRFLRQETR